MIRYYLILAAGAFFMVGGCKNPEGTVAPPSSDVNYTLPEGFSPDGLDQETMKMMLEKGDHIDYVFNHLPLSMNQDGQSAFYQEMRYASNQPAPGVPLDCKPMARKIYIGDGEILIESDLYFTDKCALMIYIRDEKPLFGNMLSQEGVTFYSNLMKQAEQTMPADVRSEQRNAATQGN